MKSEIGNDVGWSPFGFTGVLAGVVGGLLLGVGCDSRVDREPVDEERARQMGAQAKTSAESKSESKTPDRIIMLVGDGMGAAAIAGAEYTSEKPLEMLSMEEFNYVTTHSHEFVTTDSAASATAFATGEKTHYEGLSVKPGTSREQEEDEERHFETALEHAEKRGWKTGLVATVRAVHATPAAFVAHRANRHSYEAIAEDMTRSGADVVIGGGAQYFSERSDGGDLMETFAEKGYTLAKTREEMRSAAGVAKQLAAIFPDEDLPSVSSGERTKSLADMTEAAIEVLDRDNDEGFFLMVEGSQIDWRGHGLDGGGTLASTRHFDRAVGVALEYARSRDDTMVIAVADHETGGLAIMDSSQKERLASALGGEAKAREMVSYRSATSKPEDTPGPMPEVETGATVDGEAASEKVVPVFGHLSMASRPYAKDPAEFWSIHTPEIVPMFVEGKGAGYLADAGDNAEVGRRLETLIRSERSTTRARDEGEGPSTEEERPRNVVLFVGDGMGLDALTLGAYAGGGLEIRQFAHQGMVSVRGRDSIVPDDAAAATTLATGVRGSEGVLGADGADSKKPRRTFLERAEKKGYRTGIVTTGRLTNPTVSATYAHRSEASETEAIAADFVGMPARLGEVDGIDVAYGGGGEDFDGERREVLEGRGVDVATSWKGGGDRGRQVVRLLSEGRLPAAAKRRGDGSAGELPTLEEMTRTAIERLEAFERPFVLVVEASGAGRLQRDLERSRALVDAIEEFDAAVGVGREYARTDGETLVIATADADQTLSIFDNHYGFDDGICGVARRCGGPYALEPIPVTAEGLEHAEGLTDSTLQGEYAPPTLFAQYAWPVQAAGGGNGLEGMNSANPVPVFATGPWSGRLEGAMDQERIGRLLVKWAKMGR